jgi:alkanesulfonate monooxygenase SsuD/methylene tetrahydromethanopterin reductase-like flavin-dependent oxidoreductase (luciferase family)
MRQIGAKPESQLALLEETLAAVRALLAGEEVHAEGRYVSLDGVRLDHPPDVIPPVYAGVRRARSLAVSGRAADGTILSEPSAPSYIAWAREQIAATRPHGLTVYAWCAMDADGDAARARVRPLLAERFAQGGPQVEQLGIPDDERATVPDTWVDLAAVAGTPEECAAAIARLHDAGADTVVLVPPDPGVQPEQLARALVPPR